MDLLGRATPPSGALSRRRHFWCETASRGKTWFTRVLTPFLTVISVLGIFGVTVILSLDPLWIAVILPVLFMYVFMEGAYAAWGRELKRADSAEATLAEVSARQRDHAHKEREWMDIATTLAHLRASGNALARDLAHLNAQAMYSHSPMDVRVTNWAEEVWSVVRQLPWDISGPFHRAVTEVVTQRDPTETRMPLQIIVATRRDALNAAIGAVEQEMKRCRTAATS